VFSTISTTFVSFSVSAGVHLSVSDHTFTFFCCTTHANEIGDWVSGYESSKHLRCQRHAFMFTSVKTGDSDSGDVAQLQSKATTVAPCSCITLSGSVVTDKVRISQDDISEERAKAEEERASRVVRTATENLRFRPDLLLIRLIWVAIYSTIAPKPFLRKLRYGVRSWWSVL